MTDDGRWNVEASASTFTVTIWVGRRRRRDGYVFDAEVIHEVCRAWTDEVGIAVSITPCDFVYTSTRSEAYAAGRSPGAAVGLINYPIFPRRSSELHDLGLELAERLRVRLDQSKVTVVFPHVTITLGD